jgi:hypothetical protein
MAGAGGMVVAMFTMVPTEGRAECDEDSNHSVLDSGEVIIMISGHVWQVAGCDEVTSALWLPAEDVLICNDETIISTRMRTASRWMQHC